MPRNRARLLTAILLIMSAAVFTAGAIAERATATEARAEHSPAAVAGPQPTVSPSGTGEHDTGEPGTPPPSTGAEGHDHGESGNPTPSAAASESGHGGSADHGDSSGGTSHEAQAETLLGVNPEATPLIVIAVVLSLALAAAVIAVGSPLLLPLVALIMLAFAALDIRELTHQLHESRPGLAALAATVALLHLVAAVTALMAWRAPARPASSA